MFRFRLQSLNMTRFHSRGNPLNLLSENWMERLTQKDAIFEAEDVVGICKNFNLSQYENRELFLADTKLPAAALKVYVEHLQLRPESVADISLVVKIPKSPKHTYDYMLLPAVLTQLVEIKI